MCCCCSEYGAVYGITVTGEIYRREGVDPPTNFIGHSWTQLPHTMAFMSCELLVFLHIFNVSSICWLLKLNRWYIYIYIFFCFLFFVWLRKLPEYYYFFLPLFFGPLVSLAKQKKSKKHESRKSPIPYFIFIFVNYDATIGSNYL